MINIYIYIKIKMNKYYHLSIHKELGRQVASYDLKSDEEN